MAKIPELPPAGPIQPEDLAVLWQAGKTRKVPAAALGGGGSPSWDSIGNKPAVIAAGADKATARAAIDAVASDDARLSDARTPTAAGVAATLHAATVKSTPADTDEFGYVDSAAGWGLKKLTWANIKAALSSLFVSKSGGTIDGALVIAPSNAGLTLLEPATGLSKRAASLIGQWLIGQDSITNGLRDLFFYNSSAGRLAARMPHDGGFHVLDGPLGYGPGAGGTVTQPTSKSTTVTLNKPSGQITMHNAPLAAGASVVFTLNNTAITSYNDLFYPMPVALPSYRAEVAQLSPGLVQIRVTNTTTGSIAEAAALNFIVIRGAAS